MQELLPHSVGWVYSPTAVASHCCRKKVARTPTLQKLGSKSYTGPLVTNEVTLLRFQFPRLSRTLAWAIPHIEFDLIVIKQMAINGSRRAFQFIANRKSRWVVRVHLACKKVSGAYFSYCAAVGTFQDETGNAQPARKNAGISSRKLPMRYVVAMSSQKRTLPCSCDR